MQSARVTLVKGDFRDIALGAAAQPRHNAKHGVRMKVGTIVILLSVLCAVSTIEAALVRVRLPEGNARAFLVLRSLDGEDIAFGELRQKPTGGLVESR